MDNYKVVLEAIRKNDFINLLEGKNGYRYEDRLCSGPTDVGMILFCIYKIYKEIDKNISNVFVKTLKHMISGSSHDLYYATIYILFQVSRENDKEAPFNIDKVDFEIKLRERIAKDKIYLFKEKTLEGLDYTDGEAIFQLAEKLREYGMNIV